MACLPVARATPCTQRCSGPPFLSAVRCSVWNLLVASSGWARSAQLTTDAGARVLSFFDDETLGHLTEITALIGETCRRESSAVGPDPACCVEQDPLADRLARHVHGEIGVDERIVVEIQRRRGAVTKIGGNDGAHRLRHGIALDQRPIDTIPERMQTTRDKAAAGRADRHALNKWIGREIHRLRA